MDDQSSFSPLSFKVIILSARAGNLVPCVQAVLDNEPGLPAENILVVDDGARPEAGPHLPGITWLAGTKPFVFARNANLGLRTAGGDAILLNDDARLLTPGGFTRLAQETCRRPELGLCSAGIHGLVGNPRQAVGSGEPLRLEDRILAFICVFLPWATYARVGPMDERFTGYGFDDNDYCLRVRQAGLQLGIWDGCVVDHSGELPSTYRTRSDLMPLYQQNRRLYQRKWQGQAQAASSTNLRSRAKAAPAAARPLPAPPIINPAVEGLRLNLGVCGSSLEGYVNRDIFPEEGQEKVDFQQPWPWADGSVAYIRAMDFVEHLPDKVFTMNEIWRMLAAGGWAEIAVPTTDGPGAFQDPTHVSFWNRRSFLYYEAGNPYRERFAHYYGIRARFRVVREAFVQTADGPQLNLTLEAVKP